MAKNWTIFPKGGEEIAVYAAFEQYQSCAQAGFGVLTGLTASRASSSSVTVTSGTYANNGVRKTSVGGTISSIPFADTGLYRIDLIYIDGNDDTLKREEGVEEDPDDPGSFLENYLPMPPQLTEVDWVIIALVLVTDAGITATSYGTYATDSVCNIRYPVFGAVDNETLQVDSDGTIAIKNYGWSTSPALTYASHPGDLYTVTCSGDYTSTLQIGTKIKLTDSSATRYFKVVKTAYLSNTTTLTLYGSSLSGGAITDPYYSYSCNRDNDSFWDDGWIPLVYAFSYAWWNSDTKIGSITTTQANLTGVLDVGCKVRIWQGANVKFGTVSEINWVTGGTPYTSISIYFGNYYTLENASISSLSYSRDNEPKGFPFNSFPSGSGSGTASFWSDVPGSPVRVSTTQFTITDSGGANGYTYIFAKGTILKWLDGGTFCNAMVISSALDTNTVTINIVGSSLETTFTSMKYCIQPIMYETFIIPGTLGAGTDVAKTWYLPYAIYPISVDARVKTAGSTNSTVFDVNSLGSTIITTKPTITSGSTYDIDNVVTSPTNSQAAGRSITIDIDSVSTTPPVEAYIYLYYYPVSWRYR